MFRSRPELLTPFRAGERQALEAVYNAYVDDVAKLARFGFVIDGGGRVQGFADAQDQREIVQEVFIRAFSEKARAAFDGKRPFRPYLLRITKNLMIDRARSAGRKAARETGKEIDLDAVISSDTAVQAPEEDIDWKRKREATKEYIASLSDELKEFVQLRFEEGLAQAKVAEKMGITRRRVRTLEKTATTGLLRFLQSENLISTRPAAPHPTYETVRGDS